MSDGAKVGAVLAVLAVLGGLGALLATTLGGGPGPAPAPVPQVSAASLRLDLPSDWERVADPPPVPGLPVTPEIAIAPRNATGGEALLAGPVDARRPLVWPPSLFVDNWPPSRRTVDLAGARAERFSNVLLFRGQRATLYAISTGEQTYAVACVAGAARAPSFLPACEQLASTLEVDGRTRLPSAAESAYVDRVTGVIDRLVDERTRARVSLGMEEAPAARQAAATELAAAYERAAGAIPSAVNGDTGRWRGDVVAALTEAQGASSRLAGAIGLGDAAGVERSSEELTAAERRLRFVLAGLPADSATQQVLP